MGQSGSIEQRAKMIVEVERSTAERQEKEKKEIEQQKQDLCREKLKELFGLMETLGYSDIREDYKVIICANETTLKEMNFK